VRIQRHVPVFSTSRDAAKYERLKTGLALYRLVFGQPNQEDLLDGLQRQVQALSIEEQERVMKRLASYMLNLSPIGHEQALRHAEDEAQALLAGPPDGLEKLLQDVERMRVERAADVASVGAALEQLVAYVQHCRTANEKKSAVLRAAVAALAYLRNPYDRIFDLHVEGGFADDIIVLRKASALLSRYGWNTTTTSKQLGMPTPGVAL
jgi:uncharacterized membrane protein YkvA (DUF1232 family)